MPDQETVSVAPEEEVIPQTIPKPEEGEIIMTRRRLGMTRLPWIKSAEIVVYSQSGRTGYPEGFWGPNMSGYHKERSLAGVYTFNEVISKLLHTDDLYLYVRKPDPNKPKRRSNIITLLGPVVTSALIAQPNNETFRAKLMAVIGEMPPKEIDTYAKLKDWVEFNFPKTKPAKPDDEVFAGEFTYDIISTGTCKYSRTSHARSPIKLTGKQIAKIAGDASDLDELMTLMCDHMREIADSSQATTWTTGQTSTTDEQEQDSYSDNEDYAYSTLKRAAIKYLIDHEPELAEELGLNSSHE